MKASCREIAFVGRNLVRASVDAAYALAERGKTGHARTAISNARRIIVNVYELCPGYSSIFSRQVRRIAAFNASHPILGKGRLGHATPAENWKIRTALTEAERRCKAERGKVKSDSCLFGVLTARGFLKDKGFEV